MTIIALLFAALFALVHLWIGHLKILQRTPRSRWLSAAGGVAVAYVFLHILPELAEHQSVFAEELGTETATADLAIYAMSFLGLVIFYAVERHITLAQRRSGSDEPAAEDFWLHIGSFALYNVIIGYLLLHREEIGFVSLLTYGVAMTLHFVTNDFGLREDHSRRYDARARWVLAAAVLGGWGLGVVVELPELWIGMLFAFLAGGVVLNVLKEELPDERESRLLPFILGSLGYGVLLLIAA